MQDADNNGTLLLNKDKNKKHKMSNLAKNQFQLATQSSAKLNQLPMEAHQTILKTISFLTLV